MYLLFSEMYAGEEGGAKIFTRITESEQRHTEAVLGLLEAYGLPGSSGGTRAGRVQGRRMCRRSTRRSLQ